MYAVVYMLNNPFSSLSLLFPTHVVFIDIIEAILELSVKFNGMFYEVNCRTFVDVLHTTVTVRSSLLTIAPIIKSI